MKTKVLIAISIGTFAFGISFSSGLNAQTSATLCAQIDSIQIDLEAIRGLKFKQPVECQKQSLEDFEGYLDRILHQQIPDRLIKNYGKIVKKLGLYRGPEIEDFREMAKMVMKSQAAAYYDPADETFFVVMQNLPAEMMSSVYAHELYHGLQDQHFDLQNYVLDQFGGKLNDDELLARQAVVEGEATYIMTLWTMKKMFGTIPQRSMLDMAIPMQANLDVSTILQMLKGGDVPQIPKGDMAKAVAAIDSIPPFLLETLIGAYLKGMAFVFEIQKQGWEKVQNLYSRPPVSSEQILHPEKWLSNEQPYRLSLASFDDEPALQEWEVVEANTVGEIQWRIIFAEHGLAEAGKAAAAGWNGDAFAVLKHRSSEKLLLLIYSCWDSPSDAEEFHSTYLKLLKVKYQNEQENTDVRRQDGDVLIVEGASEGNLNALQEFLQKTGRNKTAD
ncbi:MAG TPA: hypothetical protein VGA99_09330 [bacterium]